MAPGDSGGQREAALNGVPFQGWALLLLVRQCGEQLLLCSLSHVRLFVTLWTVARQAPLSVGLFRQEYCGGFPFPSPNSGTEPTSPASPASQADSLPSEPSGKPEQLLGPLEKRDAKRSTAPPKLTAPSHLDIQQEQRPEHQVEVLCAEVHFELGEAFVKKERGLDFGADVALPIEGGHSDGFFGINEGYVITYSSIHISLLREKTKTKGTLSEALGWSFLCASD